MKVAEVVAKIAYYLRRRTNFHQRSSGDSLSWRGMGSSRYFCAFIASR
jgi:hypothetical protein